MATQPTKHMILSLYHASLRTSRGFSSYNFRHYFIDKTQETFRSMQRETDAARVASMYAEAAKDLTVLRRSAIVNQLYGGWKLAVEETPKSPEDLLTRGDN